jgi:magnesium transporter
MGVTNIAIYGNGRLTDSVPTLDQTFEFLRDHGGMAWISLDGPLTNDIRAIEDEFAIHELPIADAISAHQRPKLEQYNDVLFVVLRPARYTAADANVVIGELHVFVGVNFVVTIRHEDAPLLDAVAARLDRSPELLRFGPAGLLYSILDQIVDDYVPVIAGLEDDIDEVEDVVFGEPNRDVSRRIYELLRQVMGFQRATQPLDDILRMLRAVFVRAGVDEDLLAHLRDVEDHSTHVIERADGFREMLQSILTVHATLVAQRQNEESQRLTAASYGQNEQVKQISAWAGILFVPSIIASIYGMNFHHMPEIAWVVGYPLALVLMVGASAMLYREFKRREWL